MLFHDLIQTRRDCLCAFCKTPRKVYKSKHLSVIAIVGLVGLSLVLAEVIWQHLDPRGLLIFTLLLLSGELFSQVKWRQSMICQNCGFDLVLFKRNPELAGLKIKEFLEQRAERPEFLLKPTPQIPKQSRKGSNISLQG